VTVNDYYIMLTIYCNKNTTKYENK